MGTLIITFRSVTPAQRAEQLLRSVGITYNLGRTPRWMEEQGCGYSLRTTEPGAVTILRNHNIPFRRVYRQGEKGGMEEVQL